MARPLRIEFPGAIYHVMARGNARQALFHGDDDYQRMLSGLEKTVQRTGWEVHAYVWMPNHIHLLFRTPMPNLSKGMQYLLALLVMQLVAESMAGVREWGQILTLNASCQVSRVGPMTDPMTNPTSGRVPGPDVRRYRPVPGHLLIITDARRLESGAYELRDRP